MSWAHSLLDPPIFARFKMRLSEKWRICLHLILPGAQDVEIVDYHYL
jgi:plasmid maintenance system killer protein